MYFTEFPLLSNELVNIHEEVIGKFRELWITPKIKCVITSLLFALEAHPVTGRRFAINNPLTTNHKYTHHETFVL